MVSSSYAEKWKIISSPGYKQASFSSAQPSCSSNAMKAKKTLHSDLPKLLPGQQIALWTSIQPLDGWTGWSCGSFPTLVILWFHRICKMQLINMGAPWKMNYKGPYRLFRCTSEECNLKTAKINLILEAASTCYPRGCTQSFPGDIIHNYNDSLGIYLNKKVK